MTAVKQTLNEALLSESVRHAHLTEGFKKGQVRSITRMINRNVLPQMLERLAAFDDLRGSQAQRLSRTINAVSRIAEQGMGGVTEQMRRDLLDLSITEAEWQRATMQRLTPLNVSFNQPSLEVLRQVATKGAIRGRLLEDWFDGIGRATAKRVEGVLRQGLIEGQTVPEMVRAVRGTRAGAFRDGVIQTTRREAATIVRTSVNHVATQAREAAYMANKDVVKGVRWVSTLDRRTTDICISLDGRVWKVGQGQRPPAHHQCRSTTVPVMKDWKEFGIDASKVPAATRASMSGQVPAKITYQGWLRGQSVSVQNQVLGKGRAELFRAGVPVERFMTKGLKPLTIAQIINREGLAGTNITALRTAGARKLAAVGGRAKAVVGGVVGRTTAAGAERLRSAFASMPAPIRGAAESIRNTIGAAAQTRAGEVVGKIAIATPNAIPLAAQKFLKLTGASPATVRRAMGVGMAGDWGGFLAAPLLPILGAVPPGSIVVGTLGLVNMGTRAVRGASRFLSRTLRTPEALAEARDRAVAKAAERKRKKAARARRERKKAQEAAAEQRRRRERGD